MKKDAIKKAVDKATEKHVPHAIKEVARSRAFGKVYDAMHDPEPAGDKDAPVAAVAPMASETLSNAFPSSPSRGGSPVASTPAAAIAAVMTGRGGRTS